LLESVEIVHKYVLATLLLVIVDFIEPESFSILAKERRKLCWFVEFSIQLDSSTQKFQYVLPSSCT